MEQQGVLEGFEEITQYSHFKEHSTRLFIEEFFKDKTMSAAAHDYANSLLCVAYNIDRYNAATTPKNISTLMDTYNNTMASLRELYPETQPLDDEMAGLLQASSVAK